MFRRAKRGRRKTFDDIGVQTPETIAAITIQRAFRRHQSQKVCYPPRLEPYSFPVSSQPPLPSTSNAISQEKAENWIHAHKKTAQITARKFIQSIRHISFKQFTQRLQAAVQSFDTYLMGLPEEQRKFVIIIPRDKIHSSNKWVTELALPFFKKPPEDVILSDQFKEFKSRCPEVKRVVLIDDAVYSGKQLRSIRTSLYGDDYRFHAVVPYITLVGFCRITHESVWMSEHERMLSVEDLCKIGVFTPKEKELLEQASDNYDRGDLTGRSLTYFDHKIADHVSTYNNILAGGCLLVKNGFQCIPFIPSTKPPYTSAS